MKGQQQQQQQRSVRILVLGDPGVGKTSLILSLVSEEFPANVPARAEEITIPGEVTPEHVPTHIVDYSDSEQNEDSLQEEIEKAGVVCLVYAVSDPQSLEQVTSKWLPLMKDVLGEDHLCPIVLVGNKTDQVEESTLEEAIQIMNECPEVETCIECSAYNLTNISEMFYYAQKAVLHPTAPLYSHYTGELTDECSLALTRIFKICDIDNDDILNEDELNAFQIFCFDAPLEPQALEDVRSVVRDNCPEGIKEKGLALEGFLCLHVCFIQKGRPETTWITLRKFGYEGSPLGMSEDFLHPYMDVRPGCSVELSPAGVNFLQSHFDKYDKDHDGCLNPDELDASFDGFMLKPWAEDVLNTVHTDESNGWITARGYLSQWMLTAYLDRPRAVEYLGLMGYSYENGPITTAFQVSREKKVDMLKNQTNRSVFLCHVIGPKGVGKTHLLQGLRGRYSSDVSTADANLANVSAFAINTVPFMGSSEKYLLMREIDAGVTTHLVAGDLACDVACLVYDVTDPNSFAFCAKMYEKHFASQVPVLMVGCKSDLPHTVQCYELSPESYCVRHTISPPHLFSSVGGAPSSQGEGGEADPAQLYRKLITLASHIKLAESEANSRSLTFSSRLLLSCGLVGTAALALIGFAFLRYSRAASIRV